MQFLPTIAGAISLQSPDSTGPVRTSVGLSAASAAAYAKDFRLFLEGGGQFPCDADGLRRYLLKHRTLSPSTLYRRCQAIRHAHLSKELPSPTADPHIGKVIRLLHRGVVIDKKVLESPDLDAGARRRVPKHASAISRGLLARMLDPLPRSMSDRRDRALVLILFGGALRRAEAIALSIENIHFTPDAMLVSLGVRQIAIPATGGDLCAAKACRELIDRSGWEIHTTTGPLFRRAERGGALSADRLDPGAVNLIVKRLVAATGTDPARYSAESLRRGRMMEMARGRL